MDLNYLESQPEELFRQLKEAGYSERYLGEVRACTGQIKRAIKEDSSITFEQISDRFRNKYTYAVARRYCGHLCTIKFFDENGLLPEKSLHFFKKDICAIDRINAEYRQLCDYCEKFEQKERKSLEHIRSEISVFANFLEYLEKLGHQDFSQVSEKDVVEYFANPDGTPRFSYSTGKRIKRAMEICQGIRPEDCQRLLPFIVVPKRARKNIQYLNDWEIEIIKEVLESEDLSLRDKAIITILLYTGLRDSDIRTLRLDSIDWDNDFIYITQEKTDVPLKLPLTARVGNALYHYITEERPCPFAEKDEQIVFLSKPVPHQRLDSVWPIVNRFLKKCKLRTEKGDRKGTHIFRFNLVRKLLEKDVPLPEISHIVGHDSPESLKPYYNANFEDMRKCCLSIKPLKLDRSRYHV